MVDLMKLDLRIASTLFLGMLLTAVVAGPSAVPTVKLEPYVVLPEPYSLRSKHSILPKGAKRTVFTPAKQIEDRPGVQVYDDDAFNKLGISPESFIEKAAAVADARLALLQPEFIKDENGKTRYAVYRGDDPLIAGLIVAPSLGKALIPRFGDEIWAVLPDRNSLYLFPGKPELLAEFTEDLAERYEMSAYAASCEVFRIKAGQPLEVVGAFAER